MLGVKHRLIQIKREEKEQKEQNNMGIQKNNSSHSHTQFSSVAQLCPTLRPHEPRTPGLPVHHQLPESTQTHVH